MKRCPKCNRTEAEDSLTFCRVDGTPLVRESGAVSEGAGTFRFSPEGADTSETRILPTGEGRSRPTGPTTVLDGRRASGNTQELSKPKSRGGVVIAAAAAAALALGAAAYLYLPRDRAGAAKNSVAVLPFQNASGDPNMEYLSDGISESLINSLSQLPGVKVMARSTMFSFKGKDSDPKAIGRQLGVDAVLTGRVVQIGDNLSVQADLVDVSDGSQMWGERYNRKHGDILAVQEDITREIVRKLRARLSGADEQRLAKSHTTNPEAYQLYLKGRYHWNKREPEEHKKAIEYFEQAIALDPNYALAYSGLADCYAVSSSPVTGQEKFLKLRAAANKALEIDGSLGEPHAALASAHWENRDWERAEREFKRAIELSPNYATARQWYAELLTRLGRHEEAISEINRARELDPLSLIINSDTIYILTMARRYDEAIAQAKKTLEMEPSWTTARHELITAYFFKGMYEESISEEERAIDFSDRSAEKKAAARQELAALREAFRKSGANGYWQKRLELEKEDLARGEAASPFFMAEIYAHLGEKDAALKWLEKAVEERDWENLIKVYPAFDPLRSDPRFAELVRRVGLPP